jgi:hypothetical protein
MDLHFGNFPRSSRTRQHKSFPTDHLIWRGVRGRKTPISEMKISALLTGISALG